MAGVGGAGAAAGTGAAGGAGTGGSTIYDAGSDGVGASCVVLYDGNIGTPTVEAGTYTCERWYGRNLAYCSNAGKCVECPPGWQNCRLEVDREDGCETYVGGVGGWKPCPGDGG